jgi:hypothetical protein
VLRPRACPRFGSLLARLPLPLQAGALAVFFYSGVVAVAAACSDRRAASIVDLTERAAVCSALHGVPPSERIATVQTFNHPAALCGHALVADTAAISGATASIRRRWRSASVVL